MSNMRRDTPENETIDTLELDDVTGGCGACRCRGIGGVAYTRTTGFGIDPLFMVLALQVFSQNNK